MKMPKETIILDSVDNIKKYISAEIDPKYYEIITDRLKNGYIREKYKLQLRKEREEKTSELSLFSTAV